MAREVYQQAEVVTPSGRHLVAWFTGTELGAYPQVVARYRDIVMHRCKCGKLCDREVVLCACGRDPCK